MDIEDLWAQLRFRLQYQGALIVPRWARLQQDLRPQSHLGPPLPRCIQTQRLLIGPVTHLLLPLCVLETSFCCPGILGLSLGAYGPGSRHSLCSAAPQASYKLPLPPHPHTSLQLGLLFSPIPEQFSYDTSKACVKQGLGNHSCQGWIGI